MERTRASCRSGLAEVCGEGGTASACIIPGSKQGGFILNFHKHQNHSSLLPSIWNVMKMRMNLTQDLEGGSTSKKKKKEDGSLQGDKNPVEEKF